MVSILVPYTLSIGRLAKKFFLLTLTAATSITTLEGIHDISSSLPYTNVSLNMRRRESVFEDIMYDGKKDRNSEH